MKIVFLNRYQDKVERGAEVFIKELSLRLSRKYQVDVLKDKDADSLSKVLSGDYDIVIPVNGRFQSLMISFLRLIGGYKVLITGHSGKGWDDIWNIVIAKPDAFVALTDDMANWAKKWAWGSKVVKIPNGIDLDKFNPNGDKIKLDLPKPIILSVGALTWYKHHSRTINAVSKMTNGSLMIVGEGPLENDLEKVGHEKLGGRFLIKHYNYEQMPKIYRSVDLFTLPSWDREAFGIVYLEALASGLGVVAPDDLSRKEIREKLRVSLNSGIIFFPCGICNGASLMLAEVLRAITNLIRLSRYKFSDLYLIPRVHPKLKDVAPDEFNPWNSLLVEFNKLFPGVVVFEESVMRADIKTLLLASDVVISDYSTTLLQAGLIGAKLNGKVNISMMYPEVARKEFIRE